MKKLKFLLTGLVVLATTASARAGGEGPDAVVGSGASAVLNEIASVRPTVDNGKIVLPVSPDARYEVRLGGSSNESVVAVDGTVCTPLETMEVRLLYKVVNKADTTDAAMSRDRDAVIVIPGRYVAEEGDNARPQVLPGIREWKGEKGLCKLNPRSRIVVSDASLMETGEQIQYYFREMLQRPVEVVVGVPGPNDLFFTLSDRKELGNEGYGIDIGNSVRAEAAAARGLLYAGITLTQMLSQEAGHDRLPKGYIRDYPAYEVRACMLDVARFYMPLEYLEEVTKYMAYFKINEVQVHINDDGGEQQASFRVESKLFPAINSGLIPAQVYSQDAYRQYQKNAARFGVDVITEIDTPAHSRFVGLYDASLLLDDSHIDLRNEKAIRFIEQLYDEFLDGDDPVFQSRNFHIGADEYHRDPVHGEDYMRYVNRMIRYVSDKGRQPRMWASLGGGGIQGKTPVDRNVVSNYWAYSWADFPKMIDDGFRCVNTSMDIYVVPGIRTYYPDYLDLKSMYETWDATILSGGWTVFSEAHPLLVGCESAIWYDRKLGMSEYDYFDRVKDQAMLIAEKGWYGRKKADQTGVDFLARVDLFVGDVPGVNPARAVSSSSETVASYDFKKKKGGQIADGSGNDYHASADGLKVSDGVLQLDGQGALHLPFAQIGYPYTVSMDLYIDPVTPEKAILFDGDAGTLYLNYDGKGHVGYERRGYKFVLNDRIVPGRWQNLAFTCDKSCVTLYVDGVPVAKAHYAETEDPTPDSSTFVFPTESIGAGVVGKMDNLKINNHIL